MVTDDDLRLALRSCAATCELMCKRLIAAKKVIDIARKMPRAPVGPPQALFDAIAEFDKDNPS